MRIQDMFLSNQQKIEKYGVTNEQLEYQCERLQERRRESQKRETANAAIVATGSALGSSYMAGFHDAFSLGFIGLTVSAIVGAPVFGFHQLRINATNNNQKKGKLFKDNAVLNLAIKDNIETANWRAEIERPRAERQATRNGRNIFCTPALALA